MAVYTDVATEDLEAFLAGYDIGELLAYKGIAEGRRKLEFPGPHQPRLLLPDALRAAGGGRRPAVLPRPHGASGEPRHHLPAAGQEPRRGDAGHGSPASRRRSSPSWTACGCAGRAPAIAGRWARRWPGCISPAPTFAMQRANTLSVAGWRPLYDGLRRARANEVQPDLGRRARGRARPARTRLAARPAAGRDPRRPVSRQRLLPRRQALGADRLLLRLHRRARL